MIFNRSIEIIFSDKDAQILDGQSKICNWLYNQLLDLCINDYQENANKNKYLSGRNLRNQVPVFKKENPFLKSVHSSPLKNTALRLKDSYRRFFKEKKGHPKFRSWKQKWFSLFYDESNKGFKVSGRTLEISLGKDDTARHLHVTGSLKESLRLGKEENLKTFRLCKKQNIFYGIFTLEKADIIVPTGKPKTWIALDPNHKNFFMSVDNAGNSIEFKKLNLIKYWDQKIDYLKSKRDKCKRKNKRKETPHGKFYYVPSKRWLRLTRALERAQQRRREQIKQACYSLAHFLAQSYEKIVIGDYVPSKETAKYDSMHRSMLNQEVIGKFREILEWVCYKSKRQYKMQDETHTTSDCCICGNREYKDPSVREFICKGCLTFLNRDINSAVNIAKKSNLILSGSDFASWDFSRPAYTAYWNPFLCGVSITGTKFQKDFGGEIKSK